MCVCSPHECALYIYCHYQWESALVEVHDGVPLSRDGGLSSMAPEPFFHNLEKGVYMCVCVCLCVRVFFFCVSVCLFL